MNNARPLYRVMASTIGAIQNCYASGNDEWHARHSEHLAQLCRDFLPSGSGIDRGTELDFGRSGPEKLTFTFSYHHMDEHGGYDGWTDHDAAITPSFEGIDIAIGGRNRNDIKEYLYEVFGTNMSQPVEWSDEHGRYVRSIAYGMAMEATSAKYAK